VVVIEGTDFISLPTRNLERAERFYGETLGLTRSEDDTDFVAFETGNVRVLLVDPDAIGVEFAPNQNGFALRVGDVAEARRELESRRVRFFGEIVDTGVRQMAFFADPDGNGIVLHRRHAA
jgi:catechol 2,3-dioxygenase-like lactoylglutathione lyase family enzyme